MTAYTKYVEQAVKFIIDRTADGEPLWLDQGAYCGPTLMPQDHIALRFLDRVKYEFFYLMRVHQYQGAWRRGTEETEFTKAVANALASRYPDRGYKKPNPDPKMNKKAWKALKKQNKEMKDLYLNKVNS